MDYVVTRYGICTFFFDIENDILGLVLHSQSFVDIGLFALNLEP